MYVPSFNAVSDREEIIDMVRSIGVGEFVTVDVERTPTATLLPVLWDGGDVLSAHFARANPQWRTIEDGAKALVIVAGPHAYVSPSWYSSKATDPRVVPTWNYSSVHLSGTVTVHHDAGWLRRQVTALTASHESRRPEPWAVTDAPADFIDRMLKAIVGVELHIDGVDAKAKLSQNRPIDDRRGVVEGLRRDGGNDAIATAIAADLPA